MTKTYATQGINWYFPYQVMHEDEHILILEEQRRRHKFDDYQKPDKWIDIHGDYAIVDGIRKLVEIKEPAHG